MLFDENVRTGRYRECLLRAFIVFVLLFGLNLLFYLIHYLFGIGYGFGWDMAGISLMPFIFSGFYVTYLFVLPRRPFFYPIVILIWDLFTYYPYTHPQITDAMFTIKHGICNAIEFLYYYNIVASIEMEVGVLLFGVCIYELFVLWAAQQIHRRLVAG